MDIIYAKARQKTPQWFLMSQQLCKLIGDGDLAQLVERSTGTPLIQVRFPGRQGFFLPESTFSADSYGVHTTTSINTCAHD